MVPENRRAFQPLFLFFFLLVCVSRAEMPMQYLSRAELARIAGYGEERLSSVLVVGTVICNFACPGTNSMPLRTSHVSGAKVAVTCKSEDKTKKMIWAIGTTDEYGEFMVDIPSHLHAIQDLENYCTVRILRVPQSSSCKHLDFRMKPRAIKLSSVGNSIRVYSTGTVTLRNHREASYKCLQKDEDQR